MATPSAPDPTSFQSWEEAFQYPLPVVLKLSQQLRTSLSSNREKLRSLVGTSYRELLGTAERIMEMDESMRRVERELAGIGRRCRGEGLERVGENWAKVKAEGFVGQEAGERERRRKMVGTKVLGDVLRVVGRVMKTGGEALLAAKLLVVGRLLFKSLESGRVEVLGVMQELGRRLGGLRKRLLEYIRREVVGSRGNAARLTETLCGYALVTSAGPADVLRYLLQVRYDHLDDLGESPSEVSSTQMLDLFRWTLLDAQAVFPRLFSDRFAELGKGPLMDDQQIQALHQLNLDLYGGFIDTDLRTFIPWVRHEQLAAAELRKALGSWSQKAIDRLLHTVEATVHSASTGQEVVAMREKVIGQFLSLSSTFENIVPQESMTTLRKIFVSKLCTLVEQCAHRASSLMDFAANETKTGKSSNLWSLATDDIEPSMGARRFRTAIVTHRQGRSEQLVALNDRLDQWEQDVLALQELAEGMRAVKWQDVADIDFDDLEYGEVLQKSLCREDADDVLSVLCSATVWSLRDALKTIKDRSLAKDDAATLLRLVRDLRGRQRSVQQRLQLVDVDDSGSDELASTLLDNISNSVLEEPIEHYIKAMTRHLDRSTALWDGIPASPIQPSPAAFKFLCTLHSAMSDIGDDLWTCTALRALRATVRARLTPEIKDLQFQDMSNDEVTINGRVDDHEKMTADEATTNRDERDVKTSVSRADALQLLFDLLYLDAVFVMESIADAFSEAVTALRQRLNVDEAQEERLEKSAKEYWKRTYMLFGLLACSEKSIQQPYRQH